MTDVPESHPRYISLRIRDVMAAGVERGITSAHGLIAHGRGEAFDYLIGEKTQSFAKEAIRGAAAMLLLAKHAVISVNGNTAALVPHNLVELGRILNAPLEVNIFHASASREQAIQRHLLKNGAAEVLMPTKDAQLSHIDSNRKFVHPDGILNADVVFVPLEDGDRCEALRKMGKEVVTVDLNPMSRTAKHASVTIVDNVVRALPALIQEIETLKQSEPPVLQGIVSGYRNESVLSAALEWIRREPKDD
ncbi:MAG: 4-phosphopantoate--beta-alanine ligase [Candidatus Poribacteria bacterium]|nr:4-phosphopantoate--beta-alanine ligase [Candidatus Poribacteria bacterium]MDE0504658.1 4-phosphopantoate--beta-alanine ligase [Candidatus Poribacteria bacterium]